METYYLKINAFLKELQPFFIICRFHICETCLVAKILFAIPKSLSVVLSGLFVDMHRVWKFWAAWHTHSQLRLNKVTLSLCFSSRTVNMCPFSVYLVPCFLWVLLVGFHHLKWPPSIVLKRCPGFLRQEGVMWLMGKKYVLCKLCLGTSYSAVGCGFNINESISTQLSVLFKAHLQIVYWQLYFSQPYAMLKLPDWNRDFSHTQRC